MAQDSSLFLITDPSFIHYKFIYTFITVNYELTLYFSGYITSKHNLQSKRHNSIAGVMHLLHTRTNKPWHTPVGTECQQLNCLY